MIHLSNITRQHGSQVLFRDASFQILPGSRTGLVGPNGAGKTTIFRIITGEEEADSGEMTCAKRTTIGYFSQDVGDMCRPFGPGRGHGRLGRHRAAGGTAADDGSSHVRPDG